MTHVQARAPTGKVVVDYDRRHLALYAALIEAADSGANWRTAASTLMKLDLDACDAKACWQSHLDRARWLVGEGLEDSLVAFGSAGGRPA